MYLESLIRYAEVLADFSESDSGSGSLFMFEPSFHYAHRVISGLRALYCGGSREFIARSGVMVAYIHHDPTLARGMQLLVGLIILSRAYHQVKLAISVRAKLKSYMEK